MTGPAEKLYVVTGATGHLGINLILHLLAAGHTVRALVHRRTVPPVLEGHQRLTFHFADLLELDSLKSALEGAHGVFHLAGKISIAGDPDGSVWKTNVDGTKNVAIACRDVGVPRIVHCSSVHALKVEPSTAKLDETLVLLDRGDLRPIYDRSKAASMREIEQMAGDGLRLVSVLPSGVIGPHDPAPSRMGRVFVMLRERTLPALTAGAFDFVDVRDVARGMLSAMAKQEPSSRYVLGGHYVTLVELLRSAAHHVGVAAPRFVAPLPLARLSAPLSLAWSRLRSQEPLYTPESIQTLRLGRPTNFRLAEQELGYRPRPLLETISDLYASFDNQAAVLL